MIFLKKTTKIASIVLTISSGAVLIGSAVMLGIGTNMTYSFNENNRIIKMGLGSMNYGKAWVNNKEIPVYDGQQDKPSSYDVFRSQANKMKKSIEEKLKQSQNEGKPIEINYWKNVLGIFNSINTAYALMVAGAVLVSFSSVALIVGTILLTMSLNKKNKEINN